MASKKFKIKETLMALSSALGVSGSESSAHKIVTDILNTITDHSCKIGVDSTGNLMAYIGEQIEGRKTLLLDAHLDQIGFVVTFIDENGFVKLSELGRGDKRLLPAQSVTIYGEEKVRGIFTSLPPHVKTDNTKSPKLDELSIDTGFTKSELEGKIKLGDPVLIDSVPRELLNGKICGRAMDNRSGVVAVLYAISKIYGEKTDFNIIAQFTAQEEVGTRGARTSTFKISPDEAIVVDVSFGKTPELTLSKTAELGSGVMIGYSSVLSKRMSKEVTKLAKKSKIPYTIEVMASGTGTNADPIAETNAGVEAVTLSIPLRYMHTPVEVVDIADIKAVGELIAGYVLSENGGNV